MKKTRIIELRTDKNNVVYGANALGEVFFANKTQKLTEGCWITYATSVPNKKKIDPALPSTPENLRDLTPEERAVAQPSNRVLAVFPDVQSLAKGLSAALEADKHVDAYVASLDTVIKEQYAGAFEGVKA